MDWKLLSASARHQESLDRPKSVQITHRALVLTSPLATTMYRVWPQIQAMTHLPVPRVGAVASQHPVAVHVSRSINASAASSGQKTMNNSSMLLTQLHMYILIVILLRIKEMTTSRTRVCGKVNASFPCCLYERKHLSWWLMAPTDGECVRNVSGWRGVWGPSSPLPRCHAAVEENIKSNRTRPSSTHHYYPCGPWTRT